MTLWIRIDTNIGDHPNVWKLAELRGVSAVACVGHLVMLFGNVAQYRPHGDVSDVPDHLLERWAGWTSEAGLFAASFRELFVTDGVIDGWAERQGKLIERAEKEKERWHRRRLRGDSTEKSAARNVTVRTKNLSANADSAEPVIERVPAKRPRAKQPPAPFMGRLNRTWKKHLGGDMPKGSATLLAPVVADIGEEKADRRLDGYLEATDPQYVSVRSFAAKHAAYDDEVPMVDPATGFLNSTGLRTVGLR